ncbi:hypothetical protein PR202_ga11708 [Eleusine coracana subsp. coracana]|uniref:Uncharacterized protein n=1 Tax=Eleusine coracana subsp. coracana TaxID=191504 RepID=A0AAV5C9R4_ELECO|nr:hypothetical protein PR202_ga11708 [Eleusine coracana subsp. coracana]
MAKLNKKGFNTLVILGAWSLWKHRNACVFEDATPSAQGLSSLQHEPQLWTFTGAKGLKYLGLGHLLGLA